MPPMLEAFVMLAVYLVIPILFLIRDLKLCDRLRRQSNINMVLIAELDRIGVGVNISPKASGIDGINFTYTDPELYWHGLKLATPEKPMQFDEVTEEVALQRVEATVKEFHDLVLGVEKRDS